MLPDAARRRIDAFRQPRASARLARLLWIALAVVVWNVIFDRVIVVAGRQLVADAGRAAPDGPFPNIDDYMRPAVTRGFRIATAAGTSLLVIGLVSISRAGRRPVQSLARQGEAK